MKDFADLQLSTLGYECGFGKREVIAKLVLLYGLNHIIFLMQNMYCEQPKKLHDNLK